MNAHEAPYREKVCCECDCHEPSPKRHLLSYAASWFALSAAVFLLCLESCALCAVHAQRSGSLFYEINAYALGLLALLVASGTGPMFGFMTPWKNWR